MQSQPVVNCIDNTKTAIVEGAGAWGAIHPTYASYARMVGFHVDACTSYEPQQKGKTEAKVKLGRRLVEPLGSRFDSLEELQVKTDEALPRHGTPACARTQAGGRSELSGRRPCPSGKSRSSAQGR